MMPPPSEWQEWEKFFDRVCSRPTRTLDRRLDVVSLKGFHRKKVATWVFSRRRTGASVIRARYEDVYGAAGWLRDGRWFAAVGFRVRPYSQSAYNYVAAWERFRGFCWVSLIPSTILPVLRTLCDTESGMCQVLGEEIVTDMTVALEAACLGL